MTITGLGMHVPANVVMNDDLAATLDTSDEWIRQRTGIKARRFAGPGLSSSDLGIIAAGEALADADVAPEDVDLVITATLTPDQLTPATASRIADVAGCVNAGAFDLSGGCTGFIFGLAMATGAVASGLHERVLLVGAEMFSRFLDMADRGTAVLFGDGAGAVVVVPASSQDSGRILGFDLGGIATGADILGIPAGGSMMPASHDTVENRMHCVKMNGAEVYKFATRVMTPTAGRVLERCGRTVEEIDLFIPHQANLRIIEAGAKNLGIPESKIYTNVQRYGNTSGASIPLCLAEARAEGRLKAGDLVLLMGFGAGLTWGACLLEWGEGSGAALARAGRSGGAVGADPACDDPLGGEG
ncbi:MAG: beta-ketoacyl-ACP synthase III [bacterium]